MEQRTAYLRDQEHSAEEAQTLQEQKADAAKQLQNLVNGQKPAIHKSPEVVDTVEGMDAWKSLLQDESHTDDEADDPWLQDALSAWTSGGSRDCPATQAKLQAWLSKHSQMIPSTSPSTPKRSSTALPPMTPRDKTRAPTRVAVRPEAAAVATSGTGLGTPPVAPPLLYGSAHVDGTVHDPYLGSPLPVEPMKLNTTRAPSPANTHIIRQKPHRGENRTPGEVGYGRTPLKEATKLSPKPTVASSSNLARQDQIEAKRAEAMKQLQGAGEFKTAQFVIHNDDSDEDENGKISDLGMME